MLKLSKLGLNQIKASHHRIKKSHSHLWSVIFFRNSIFAPLSTSYFLAHHFSEFLDEILRRLHTEKQQKLLDLKIVTRSKK